MKRPWLLVGALSLLALLAAGCVSQGYAGQENGDQAPSQVTPSPNLVDPSEAKTQNLPALKVMNLKLPCKSENSCPEMRVYARTDKLQGEQSYLVMTVTQADKSACDPANVERLADALIAEVQG